MALRPIQPISLSRGRTKAIRPFEPDEEEIEKERARIEAEGSENLFFRALRAPKRLLGGESIQGGLEGLGREGIGEGARKAFVNNPFFQVLEGVSNVTESLFGLDIAEGAGDALEFLGLKEEGSVGLVEDTDFEDVRDAFGVEGFDNKIADGATLLLGELVTSPFELFFTPFGLTKAGYAAKALKGTPKAAKLGEAAGEVARLAGKGEQEIAQAIRFAAGEVPPDLGKATEAGLRTMFNFKVPFKDNGFSFPLPKNLDLYSARVIQGTADWLNVNPATAGIMRMFNSSQIKEGDAAVRSLSSVSEDVGKLAANEYEATFLSKLSEAIAKAPNVALENPDFNKVIAQMTELGIKGADSKADIARIFSEGRSFLGARKAKDEVLGELLNGGTKLDDKSVAFKIDDDATIGFNATVDGKAGRYVDAESHPGRLIEEGLANKTDITDAVDQWQQAFPKAQVPTKALDGVVDQNIFRKGIDVPDPDEFKPTFSDPAIDAAIPGASPADIAIRADIALQQQGTLAKTIQDVRTRVLPEILDEIDRIDSSGKLLTDMQEFSESMQKLGQDMAEKDLGDGIINGAVEMYLPRDLTPEARDLIGAKWSKIGAPRSLDELTVVEANAYAVEYGLKLTKERSVSDLVAKEGDGAFFKLMATIFPDKFVQDLKTIAKGGDAGALELATFFDTNPVRSWYGRIEKSASLRNTRAFNASALEAGSPMVLRETTYGEVLRDLEGTVKAQKEGNKFLVTETKGGKTRFTEVNDLGNSKVKADAFALQESAKARLGTKFLRSLVETELSGPRANVDLLMNEISDAIKLRDLKVRNIKSGRKDLAVRKTPKAQAGQDARLATKKADHEAMANGPMKDTPLAKNIEEQIEVMENLDEIGLGALDASERLALSQGADLLTPFDNEIVRIGREIDNLKDASLQVKGAKQGIDKASDTKAAKAKIAALVSERKGLLKKRQDKIGQHGRLGDAEVTLAGVDDAAVAKNKALDDAIQSEKEGLEIRIESINEELGNKARALEAMPKNSENWRATKALEDKLVKRRSELADEIKTNKAYKKDRASYVRRLKEKASKESDLVLKDLEEKERIMRQGTSDFVDGMRRDRKEFRDLIGATEADATERVSLINKATGAAKADIENSTKAFNDLFEVHMLQKEHGSIPLENLGKMDQLAVDTMLAEAGGSQRVVMVDSQSYDEILHPVTGLMARKNKPDFLAKHLTAFDTLTNVWKAWTTLPVFAVATRTRDQITNFIMQVQGGMKPQNLISNTGSLRFNKALGKSISTGDFTALREMPVTGRIAEATGTKDGYGLFQYLYARDIISPNMIKQQTMIEAGTKYIDVSKALPFGDVDSVKTAMQAVGQRLGTRNSIIQKGTRMAEFLDDQIKVQSWMSHVIDGKNGDEAAGIVRKWIYDPRRVDSSSFEKTVLKRFIPFYSYARFAVKAQVEAYFTKPGTVAFWDKLSTSSQALTGLSEAEQEIVLPDFIKDNFGVPTSVEDGVIKLRMFGSNIPIAEIGRLANAVQDTFSGDTEKGIGSELGARMNPLIRLPIEQAINESFFSQRPIQRFEGEQVEYLGTTMDASMRHNFMSIRFLNEIDRLGVFGRKGVNALLAGESTVDDRGQSLGNRAFNSAFSPVGALGRSQPRIIQDDAGRAIQREKSQVSKARSEITRALARQERTGVSETENLKALQSQIAERVAKIRIANEAAERNQ